jgi:two-component system, LytTR family, response regulator
MTCLIVDDEPNAAALLTSYAAMISTLKVERCCYDAMEALEYLQNHSVDVIFLDIQMQGLTGMELASLLPPQSAIIFTTAYSQFAVESYEKNATDYLLKPISFKRFIEALARARKKITGASLPPIASPEEQQFVFVKSGKQLLKIDYASVLYIEGEKEYVRIVTTKTQPLLYRRMKDMADHLPSFFARVHNSYIVNINHIVKIEDNHVWIGDKRMAISEKYKDEFLDRINKLLL